jgi:hypothetical protein
MDQPAQWMGLRAYARSRNPQVSLHAVQKAIESGRVTAVRREGDRIVSIEKIEADRQWTANTDPVESERNGKIAASAEPAASGEKAAEPKSADQESFLAARLKGVELDNQVKELDKLERLGELVPRAIVQQIFSEILTQLQSAAFRIADRKAQALAGETDPTRIHRMLTDELRTVFDESSREFAASAAGMADDAGMARGREPILS